MDDKALLELAAKAAGVNAQYSENFGDFSIGAPYSRGERRWNPLTDDGDAFRLAVKLSLKVKFNSALYQALVWDFLGREFVENVEDSDRDPNAATRRAITRAAAAIAEQQNGGSNGS